MPVREYSGAAKATTLSGSVTAAATVINVVDATGWPTGAVGPFVITLDAGVTTEEKVLVSGRTGNSLTVSARGFDGTTASDHGNAARVEHTLSATDIREANAHVNDTSGDPHPQYLTAAEGAALYPTLTHGHAYSNLDHSHTYDSITLKPTVGLLAVTNRIVYSATVAGSFEVVPSADVTFTFPTSGRVLVRQSGVTNTNSTGTIDFSFYLGRTGNLLEYAQGVLSKVSSTSAPHVNVAHLVTGAAGTSATYRTSFFVSGAPVAINWHGHVEVWAAP